MPTEITIRLAIVVLLSVPGTAQADSWAAPQDREYRAENGQYQFKVQVGAFRESMPCQGVLTRTGEGEPRKIWEAKLVNRFSPVSALVHNSGRYVVTFDDWARVAGVHRVDPDGALLTQECVVHEPEVALLAREADLVLQVGNSLESRSQEFL